MDQVWAEPSSDTHTLALIACGNTASALLSLLLSHHPLHFSHLVATVPDANVSARLRDDLRSHLISGLVEVRTATPSSSSLPPRTVLLACKLHQFSILLSPLGIQTCINSRLVLSLTGLRVSPSEMLREVWGKEVVEIAAPCLRAVEQPEAEAEAEVSVEANKPCGSPSAERKSSSMESGMEPGDAREESAAGFEKIRIATVFPPLVRHTSVNRLADVDAAMVIMIIDGLAEDGLIRIEERPVNVFEFLTSILTEMMELFEVGVHRTPTGHEVSPPLDNSIRGWMELEARRVRWASEGAARFCVSGHRMFDMHWTMRSPPNAHVVSWLG